MKYLSFFVTIFRLPSFCLPYWFKKIIWTNHKWIWSQ